MMDRLREGVNNIAIKIILAVIILSFVLAGVSSYLVGGSTNTAAKVDGATISRSEFEQAYQNERNRMQSQMGDYFSSRLSDPSYVKMLRQSVLNQMINDLLIEQHAKSLGLSISDAQVRDAILKMPAFQNGGKFDKDIYNMALQRANLTPDSFAKYMRNDLMRTQLLDAIEGSTFSLPKETEALANLFLQTRTYRAIKLDESGFAKSVEVSDKEVSDYYQAHKNDYALPEQYKLAYLELSADKLKDTIPVSDSEAKTYYQNHLAQYSTKEQREVSHILLSGKDKKAAEALLTEVKNGADFAKLAKEKSLDKISAKQGGSLGWLEQGTINADLDKAIFAMKKKGEVALVKSSFGYHIVKLDDIKPAQAKPFNDVKADVIAAIQGDKAANAFYGLQTKLDKVAFESPNSLDESAKAINGKVVKTDFIALDKLPKLLQNDEVKKALQTSDVKKEGLNSSVIELGPEDVVVVRIDGFHPATVQPLDKVKDEIKQHLISDKAMAAARKLADSVVAALSKGDQSVLAKNNLAFGKEMTVGRQDAIAGSIFSMKKPTDKAPSYSVIKTGKNNLQIVELTKIGEANNPNFAKQLAAQTQRLDTQLNETGILSILRKNGNIKVYNLSE